MVAYYRLKDFGFKLAAGGHVVPRSEFTPIEEANRLVTDAEATCHDMFAQAQRTYESEKQRGYEEGLQQAQLEAIRRVLAETAELNQGLLAVEHDLARLVAECVHKLVAGFDDVTRAEAVVGVALKQMRREKRAELRVPSALLSHFKMRIGSILREFPEVELVDVVEDRALGPTRIVLETSIGRVDGDIAQRLDDLETVIRSAFAKSSVDVLDALGSMSSGEGS